MTWRARFRFRILGLLHVLAGISPGPQRISLSFYLQLSLTTRGSVHVRLHVPAWMSKLCPTPLAFLGLQGVYLADAICSWEVSPGEEAHTVLEGNPGTPGCMVWDTECGLWVCSPLSLADSASMKREQQRRTRWGLCGHSTFNWPNPSQWQWTSGQRDSLGRRRCE